MSSLLIEWAWSEPRFSLSGLGRERGRSSARKVGENRGRGVRTTRRRPERLGCKLTLRRYATVAHPVRPMKFRRLGAAAHYLRFNCGFATFRLAGACIFRKSVVKLAA